MSELILFDKGIKPAILLTNVYAELEHLEKLVLKDGKSRTGQINRRKLLVEEMNVRLSKHPHVLSPSGRFHLIFQSQEILDKYLKSENQESLEELNMIINHRLLGDILGFPPKAKDKFDEITDKYDAEKAEINYFGIIFISAIEDIQENIDWMFNNLPVPTDVEKLLKFPNVSVTLYTKMVVSEPYYYSTPTNPKKLALNKLVYTSYNYKVGHAEELRKKKERANQSKNAIIQGTSPSNALSDGMYVIEKVEEKVTRSIHIAENEEKALAMAKLGCTPASRIDIKTELKGFIIHKSGVRKETDNSTKQLQSGLAIDFEEDNNG